MRSELREAARTPLHEQRADPRPFQLLAPSPFLHLLAASLSPEPTETRGDTSK